MNRFVLALLALLTGLVAPVAPAQARMGGGAQVGAVESLNQAAKACSTAATTGEVAVCRTEKRDRTVAKTRPVRSRIVIPTVFFGVDRALE